METWAWKFVSRRLYLYQIVNIWLTTWPCISECLDVCMSKQKKFTRFAYEELIFFSLKNSFSLLLFSFFTFCVCVFVRVSRIYLPQKKLILPRLSPVSKEEYCFVKENEFSIVKDHRNYVCDFFSLYFLMLLIFWILHFRGLVF